MISAPYPQDEGERLQLLERSGLLGDEHDTFLDALAITMARTFRVPTALVSLIDADRQFFKAFVGLAVRETPRACSFCAHVLWWPQPLIVLDATQDPRFNDNPLVLGSPQIRFYAGVPVFLRGICLGTLCIIDTRPRRQFHEHELRCLKGAATAVEERLMQMIRLQATA